MKLNSDLGEGINTGGPNGVSVDAQLMPYLDQASIACGFHAGDPKTIIDCIRSAIEHRVSIGAHPSYPDKENFGRRSMPLSEAEIIALMHYQLAAVDGLCQTYGAELDYVKPHGALYNDMLVDEKVCAAVMQAVAGYSKRVPLMMLASPNAERHRQNAGKLGLNLLFEGFADRRYTDAGHLLPRSENGAVLDAEQSLKQFAKLTAEGCVETVSGRSLELRIDSLCVHGDTAEALQCVKAMRAKLAQSGNNTN